MNNATNVQPTNDDPYELRIITKAVAFLALLTGLLYLRVIVGDAIMHLRAGEFPLEATLLLAFLVIATTGLVIAWRWEGAGGLLALTGGIGLAVIDYSAFGRGVWFAALLYSSPFIISGILCLGCWWQKRFRAAGV